VPQNVYDLDAEYSLSHFDSPHRIILAPSARIPGPSSGIGERVLGGWNSIGSSLCSATSALQPLGNLGPFAPFTCELDRRDRRYLEWFRTPSMIRDD
jgi:hypothetical protein